MFTPCASLLIRRVVRNSSCATRRLVRALKSRDLRGCFSRETRHRTHQQAGFAAAVLALNVVAAIVAVVVNLPTQFGKTGTDAGEDVLTSGTAISAPLLPVAILLVSLVLVLRRDRWGLVGIGGTYAAALLFLIGGIGEIAAEGTSDTPKAVLVVSGIVWAAIAIAFMGLATAAAMERRAARSQPG